MSAFEIVHQDRIAGKLTCFDRLIFKGHLSRLYPAGGMKAFLDSQGVLLKCFGTYVRRITEEVKAHAQGLAERTGCPYLYLAETHTKASGTSKEGLAREIAARDGVQTGLVCVLAAVEPCRSFDIFRNRATHRLEVVRRRRQVPAPVLLLPASRAGVLPREAPDVVPVRGPGVGQRPGGPSPGPGPPGGALPPPRQRLPEGGQLGPGPAPGRSAGPPAVASPPRPLGPGSQPPPGDDLPGRVRGPPG
jgi:hypothetical protein